MLCGWGQTPPWTTYMNTIGSCAPHEGSHLPLNDFLTVRLWRARTKKVKWMSNFGLRVRAWCMPHAREPTSAAASPNCFRIFLVSC